MSLSGAKTLPTGSDAEIVELTFLVGYINMLNWFNNALQVEYRGELA